MSQVFSKLLSDQGHGRALRIPEPDENLPAGSRGEDTLIGSVIQLTTSGGIDVLFNLRLPASHPINGDGLPEEHVELRLGRRDVSKHSHMLPPGAVISSERYRRSAFSTDIPCKGSPFVPASPGIGFCADFTEQEGALLYLPKGASRQQLLNISALKSLADLHASKWYDFARKRGRTGPIFVVTACVMTSMWGMISFTGAAQSTGLTASVNALGLVDGKISWELSSNDYSSLEFRVGPTPPSSLRDQCVFIEIFEVPDKGFWRITNFIPREVGSRFKNSQPIVRRGSAPAVLPDGDSKFVDLNKASLTTLSHLPECSAGNDCTRKQGGEGVCRCAALENPSTCAQPHQTLTTDASSLRSTQQPTPEELGNGDHDGRSIISTSSTAENVLGVGHSPMRFRDTPKPLGFSSRPATMATSLALAVSEALPGC